eukprot:744311_1
MTSPTDEEKFSPLRSVGGYLTQSLNELSSYIPPGIKSAVSSRVTSLAAESTPLRVVWKSFQNFSHQNGQCSLFLFIGLIDGFQIFWSPPPSHQLHSQSPRLHKTRRSALAALIKVASNTEWAVKCAKILYPPSRRAKDVHEIFTDNALLVALIPSTHSADFPLNTLKLFSITRGCYVRSLDFKSAIFDIVVSSTAIAVILHEEIQFLSSSTLERTLCVRCAPNPALHAPVSVGVRLVAFASAEIPSTDTPSIGNLSVTPRESLTDDSIEPFVSASLDSGRIAEVATDLASDLYTLGDSGRKAIASYLCPHDEIDHHSTSSTPQGIIAIRDIADGEVIGHFRAHDSRISCLAFDPPGTLLISVPESGQYLHIYKIEPRRSTLRRTSDQSTVPVGGCSLIYRIFRGITHASIREVSFNLTSHWLSVCSSRGTSHIFAINPRGGQVSSETHSLYNSLGCVAPISADDRITPITLSAVYRIRSRWSGVDTKSPHPSVAATFHLSPDLDTEHLFVANETELSVFQLVPTAETEDTSYRSTTSNVELDVTPLSTTKLDSLLDIPVCDTIEQKFPSSLSRSSTEHDPPDLFSQAELTTCHPDDVPLWASPQFTFQHCSSSKHSSRRDVLDYLYLGSLTEAVDLLHPSEPKSPKSSPVLRGSNISLQLSSAISQPMKEAQKALSDDGLQSAMVYESEDQRLSLSSAVQDDDAFPPPPVQSQDDSDFSLLDDFSMDQEVELSKNGSSFDSDSLTRAIDSFDLNDSSEN